MAKVENRIKELRELLTGKEIELSDCRNPEYVRNQIDYRNSEIDLLEKKYFEGVEHPFLTKEFTENFLKELNKVEVEIREIDCQRIYNANNQS